MLKLGLGTAAIGRPRYINIQKGRLTDFKVEAFEKEGLALLDQAYSSGIRYYDTAPGYGMAEKMLIKWAKKYNDIEIATKWGYTYVADFDPKAKVHEVKEHSLSKLEEQWTRSQLLIPQLSVYQIHSATLETGVLQNQAILNRLAQLKAENGLQIGVTTTGPNQTEVIKKAVELRVNGIRLFDVFQVTYNILDQSLSEAMGYFDNGDRRLVIKEALANGRLFRNKDYPLYEPIYKTLEGLAGKYEVGIDAIALRFCMDSVPATAVLSGAAVGHHLDDNLKSESIKLSHADIAQLQSLAIDANAYWTERKRLKWN